ncbi:hypothetical protein RRG08_026986 [Elysia crispata]|uniref:Uncharacterized protein n=1 Tax=Elysia crispata TaxID=231223 RepID=A0AAE1DZ11_9GAST|nr:hypothetical protein RRG08_026986 [Elysia crispata]
MIPAGTSRTSPASLIGIVVGHGDKGLKFHKRFIGKTTRYLDRLLLLVQPSLSSRPPPYRGMMLSAKAEESR